MARNTPFHSLSPSKSSIKHQCSYQVESSKPQDGFVRINFDGSKSSTVAGIGFVIRGWKGNFIAVGYRFMEWASIIVTEATIMRDGVKEAIHMDLSLS